jgi:hypothetical protein
MAERWVSTKEFGAKYGLHPGTLYMWIRQKRVRFVKRDRRIFIHDPGYLDNITTAPNEIKEIDRIPMLRGTELAKLLGITPRAVRYLAEHNQLGFRKIGHRRRYSVEDVRKIIAFRQNGHRSTNAKQRREVILQWVKQRLAQNP